MHGTSASGQLSDMLTLSSSRAATPWAKLKQQQRETELQIESWRTRSKMRQRRFDAALHRRDDESGIRSDSSSSSSGSRHPAHRPRDVRGGQRNAFKQIVAARSEDRQASFEEVVRLQIAEIESAAATARAFPPRQVVSSGVQCFLDGEKEPPPPLVSAGVQCYYAVFCISSDAQTVEWPRAEAVTQTEIEYAEAVAQTEIEYSVAVTQTEIVYSEAVTQTDIEHSDSVAQTEIASTEAVTQTETEYSEAVAQTEILSCDAVAQTETEYSEAVAQTEIASSEAVTQTETEYSEAVAQTEIESSEAVTQTEIEYSEAVAQTEIECLEAVTQTEIEHSEGVAQTEIEQSEADVQTERGEFSDVSVQTNLNLDALARLQDKASAKSDLTTPTRSAAQLQKAGDGVASWPISEPYRGNKRSTEDQAERSEAGVQTVIDLTSAVAAAPRAASIASSSSSGSDGVSSLSHDGGRPEAQSTKSLAQRLVRTHDSDSFESSGTSFSSIGSFFIRSKVIQTDPPKQGNKSTQIIDERIAAFETTIEALQAQALADAASHALDASKADERIVSLEATIEELHTEARTDAASHALQASAARESIESLEATIEALKAQARTDAVSQVLEASTASDRIVSLQATIEQLHTQARTDAAAQALEASAARERLTAKSLEASTASERIVALEAIVETLQAQALSDDTSQSLEASTARERIVSLEATIETLETQARADSTSRAKAIEEIASLEAIVETLQAQALASDTSQASEASTARERIASLEKTIETLRAQARSDHELILRAQARTDYELEASTARERIASLEATIETLKTQARAQVQATTEGRNAQTRTDFGRQDSAETVDSDGESDSSSSESGDVQEEPPKPIASVAQGLFKTLDTDSFESTGSSISSLDSFFIRSKGIQTAPTQQGNKTTQTPAQTGDDERIVAFEATIATLQATIETLQAQSRTGVAAQADQSPAVVVVPAASSGETRTAIASQVHPNPGVLVVPAATPTPASDRSSPPSRLNALQISVQSQVASSVKSSNAARKSPVASSLRSPGASTHVPVIAQEAKSSSKPSLDRSVQFPKTSTALQHVPIDAEEVTTTEDIPHDAGTIVDTTPVLPDEDIAITQEMSPYARMVADTAVLLDEVSPSSSSGLADDAFRSRSTSAVSFDSLVPGSALSSLRKELAELASEVSEFQQSTRHARKEWSRRSQSEAVTEAMKRAMRAELAARQYPLSLSVRSEVDSRSQKSWEQAVIPDTAPSRDPFISVPAASMLRGPARRNNVKLESKSALISTLRKELAVELEALDDYMCRLKTSSHYSKTHGNFAFSKD